jgi:hypothetical protein
MLLSLKAATRTAIVSGFVGELRYCPDAVKS